MNILILAAGFDGPETADQYPLFLSEIDGETIIERLVRNCLALSPERLILAIRKQDVRNHHLNDIIRLLAPQAIVVEIAGETRGAACTALLTIDHLALDEELFITNATDIVDANLGEIVAGFREQGADAGTVFFDSIHPRYSFVRLEEGFRVVEVAEKRPISRNATVGFYWFRKAADFVNACQRMIAKDGHVNGQFYVSPTLNEMLLDQKLVVATKIRTEQYHPIKSAKHIAAFETLVEQLRSLSET